MSGIIFSKNNIRALVEHHIALLSRFDSTEEEEFSIIYFNLDNKKLKELSPIFDKVLRKTDAIFKDDDDVIVMLTGTDWNGATVLLSGIQEFLSQPKLDNIVSYPYDGKSADELLEKLHKNIKRNCDIKVKLLKDK